MSEKLCGRCVRKEQTLDLETRMNLAKSIERGEIYECPACSEEFYLLKYRIVYMGDKVSKEYKSVLE